MTVTDVTHRSVWNFVRTHRTDIVIVGLLVLFLAPLYTYTTFAGTNWSFHPDDHEYLYFGERLARGESLMVDTKAQAYPVFDDPIFAPSGVSIRGQFIVPQRSYAMYYLTALGLRMHPDAPYVLVSLIGLLGIVFLYALLRTVCSRRVSLLGTVIAGVSFPYVYWSNMLYPNLPAVVFLLGTALTLWNALQVKMRSFLWLATAGLCFVIAIWFRYESVLFAVFALPLLGVYRRNIRWRDVLIVGAMVVMLLSPILLLNRSFYGSAFASPYTDQLPAAQESVDPGTVQESTFLDGITKVYRRFFTQVIHPDLHLVLENYRQWVWNLSPLLTSLSLGGFVVLVTHWQRRYWVLISLLLYALAWSYSSNGGILWGYRTAWLGTTYIRYSILLYVLIAVFAAYFLTWIAARMSRRQASMFLLSAFIIIAGETVTLYAGNVGLYATTDRKVENHRLQEFVEQLPDRSVVISGFYEKYIIGHLVLNPFRIPEERRIPTMEDDVATLIDDGYSVYVLENPSHESTYLGIRDAFASSTRLRYSARESAFGEFGEFTGADENGQP